MPKYEIEIDELEDRILRENMISVEDWIRNMVQAKVNRCTERLIRVYTNLNPVKLSAEEKIAVLSGTAWPTAIEKDAATKKLIEGL